MTDGPDLPILFPPFPMQGPPADFAPTWRGVLIVGLIERDPRFTREQHRQIQAVAVFDLNAEVVGVDARYRPVVLANLGVPRAPRAFALERDGSPAAVALTYRPAPDADCGLLERWTEVGQSDRDASSPRIR